MSKLEYNNKNNNNKKKPQQQTTYKNNDNKLACHIKDPGDLHEAKRAHGTHYKPLKTKQDNRNMTEQRGDTINLGKKICSIGHRPTKSR